MHNHTSRRPVMLALQDKIRKYSALNSGRKPRVILLSTFYFAQLMEEAGDGTYYVPEHRFPTIFPFHEVEIWADISGILEKNEPYAILELKKVKV